MRKCATLIIGSGESGMEAAEFLAQNNEFVIICEQEELGGSYTTGHDLFLKDALEYGKDFEKYLLQFRDFHETYSVLASERDALLEYLNRKEEQRLVDLKNEYSKNPNIEVFYGQARLISPSLAEVSTSEGRELISFESCILATGKQEVQVPYIDGSDFEHVWNEYSIFQSNTLPRSIAIIGCTEETLDYAFLYANLGIKVHILEQKKSEACLPHFDKTVLNVIFKRLLTKQVEFRFSTNVRQIRETKKGLAVLTGNEEVEVTDILLATKKLFTDTVAGLEQGLKVTHQGYVTNSEGKIYGSEKIYAVGEANDKFEVGKNQEMLHHALYAIIQESSKSRQQKNSSIGSILSLQYSGEVNHIRSKTYYPRMIGSFEGITLGLSEHEAKSMYGPLARSDAYETAQGDVVKIVYNVQSEKIISIAMSGRLSKECLLFALYCVDGKRKHYEFSTYLRNYLELL